MPDKKEIQNGVVIKMENDYSEVELEKAGGDKYTRYFDTPDLIACGIEKAGVKIRVVFEKKLDPALKQIEVRMTITKKSDGADNDFFAVQQQVQKIVAETDMKRIKHKFRPVTME